MPHGTPHEIMPIRIPFHPIKGPPESPRPENSFFDEKIGKLWKLLTSAHFFLGLRAEWRVEDFFGVGFWQPLPTLVQANDFHFHILEVFGRLSWISFVAPAAIKNCWLTLRNQSEPISLPWRNRWYPIFDVESAHSNRLHHIRESDSRFRLDERDVVLHVCVL